MRLSLLPLTATQRKLERARYFLGQAKNTANEYDNFVANLDAFLSVLNSVWEIAGKEFQGEEFREWYHKKENELYANTDIQFFRKKRNHTEHFKPFEAGQDDKTLYTDIQEPFIVRGGATVGFPMIKDEKDNTKPDDESPVLVDGQHVKVKRKTSIKYYFIDRPNENAIVLSDAYFNLISDMVAECHEKFNLADRKQKGKKS